MNWVQRLPGAIVFFARGAFTSVFGNLSLALLSIALAVTLWVYVTDRENPSEVQTFNGSIPVKFVNIPNGLDVANASETTVQLPSASATAAILASKLAQLSLILPTLRSVKFATASRSMKNCV